MTPRWSVVVPTRDRPAALAGCLEALAATQCTDFEVVVVDDAGAAQLDEVVAPFRKDLDVVLIRRPRHGGPGASRNAGVARTRGELLAFTDDDCRPDPLWLAALEDGIGAGVLAGGRVIAGPAASPYATASQTVLDLVYAHYNEDHTRARFVASNNMAVTARSFRELGGFDTRFRTSEDRDLCDRWLHAGGHIAYLPDAVVRHEPDLSLPGFCRQHFGYGRGAFRFHRERARRGSGRLTDELGFYPGTARRLAARRVDGPRTAGLLALWQVANAAGFAWEAARFAAGAR